MIARSFFAFSPFILFDVGFVLLIFSATVRFLPSLVSCFKLELPVRLHVGFRFTSSCKLVPGSCAPGKFDYSNCIRRNAGGLPLKI